MPGVCGIFTAVKLFQKRFDAMPKIRARLGDLLFLIGLGILLLLLSETDNFGLLGQYPYIAMLLTYWIGRMVGKKQIVRDTP